MMILRKFRKWLATKIIAWKYNNKFLTVDYFPNMIKIRVKYLSDLKRDFVKYSWDGKNYFDYDKVRISEDTKKAYHMLMDNLTGYYTDTYSKAKDLIHEFAHTRRILNYLNKHKMLNAEKQKVRISLNKAFAEYVTVFNQFPPEPDVEYFIKLEKQNEMLKDMEDDFN